MAWWEENYYRKSSVILLTRLELEKANSPAPKQKAKQRELDCLLKINYFHFQECLFTSMAIIVDSDVECEIMTIWNRYWMLLRHLSGRKKEEKQVWKMTIVRISFSRFYQFECVTRMSHIRHSANKFEYFWICLENKSIRNSTYMLI